MNNPQKIKSGPPNQPEEIGDIVRLRGKSEKGWGVCHDINPNLPDAFWVWWFDEQPEGISQNTLCHKFELEKGDWDDVAGTFYVKQIEHKKKKSK